MSRHGRRRQRQAQQRQAMLSQQRQASLSSSATPQALPSPEALASGRIVALTQPSGRAIASYAHTAAALQAQQARSAAQITQPGVMTSPDRQYPAMPKIAKRTPLLESMGAPGTAIFQGIITNDDYNPDFYWRDAIEIYDQMVRNDGQIMAIVQQLELPIRRATWTVEPFSNQLRDKEVASFVESCLYHDLVRTTADGRRIRQKWDDILRHALMMLRYGFAAFEKVWRQEDGWVKLAQLMPLLPMSVYRWWVGQDNELVGIQQYTFKDYTYCFVDIPADKVLVFTHRQEGQNFQGFSLLRAAYKHWYYKDQFYKIDAIGLERNAIAVPYIELPPSFNDADVTQAQAILANLRANESMGVTIPPDWHIGYIPNSEHYQGHAMKSIEHHDVMIARSVLAQFLNLGSTETGTYNLAVDQRQDLLESLQAESEYIEDTFNADLIPQLVDFNFASVEGYPRIKCSKLAQADITELTDAISKLKARNANFLTPDPELEDWVRDQFGMPKASRSLIAGANPTSPTTPQRPDAQPGQPSDHTDAESTPVAGKRAPESNEGAPDTGGASGGGDATQASELVAETRALREALSIIAGMDATERGLTAAERLESLLLFNVNHDEHNGQFTSGSDGSGESSTGGGYASHHWEGKSTWGNWSPSHKGQTGSVDAHGGKATLTVTSKNGQTVQHVIEADHEYGGYKATNTETGKVEHGLSLKAANEYIKGEVGGPISAQGSKLLKGGHVIDATMLEKGAKPSAAQKALNKANEEKALATSKFDAATKHGSESAPVYTNGGKSIEYHHPDGSMVRVTRNADDKSFTVETFKAKADSAVTPAESYWNAKNGSGSGEHSYNEKPASTKVYKTTKGVNGALDKAGVVNNTFTVNHLAYNSTPSPSSPTPQIPEALQHSPTVSPHSTTGWNQAMQSNLSTGAQLAEGATGHSVGAYELRHGNTKIGISTSEQDGTTTLTYQKSNGHLETVTGLSASDAKANMVAHGVKDEQAHQFIDMSQHDIKTYTGEATPEQAARIAQVAARRSALDAKFGPYSAAAAKSAVSKVYSDYPEVRSALTAHLNGGPHFQESAIAAKASSHLSAAQRAQRAHEGLARLREVSEWSLLHQSNVTREGTIRLYHGTNGKSGVSVWKQRLESASERRGTPMTDRWSVARSFSDSGSHGRLIVSAHVPVEAISAWHGIRSDSLYSHEREYTLGTGKISDYHILNLNTMKH